MIAIFHGHNTDLQSIRSHCPPSARGASLKTLIQQADRIGLSARALRAELSDLPAISKPAILHWDLSHFVVLTAIDRNNAYIVDPAVGVRVVPFAEFNTSFSGVLLELKPTSEFRLSEKKPRLRLTDVWGSLSGLYWALAYNGILSLACLAASLASPLYLQFVVDEAIASGGLDVLTYLLLGFGGLLIVASVAEFLRTWSTILLTQTLSAHGASNIVHHMLRLPLPYFETRPISDMLLRVGSLQPVQQSLSSVSATLVVDIATFIFCAIVVSYYSLTLATVVFGALACHLIVFRIVYPLQRVRKNEEILARTKEQGQLLETVRAIDTIKIFGIEAERKARWRKAFTDALRASTQVNQYEALAQLSRSMVSGFSTLLILFVGSQMVSANENLSLGMLLAFLSYSRMVTDSGMSLTNHLLQWQVATVHLERLGDIVYANPEPLSETALEFSSSIEVDGLSFRYSENDPFVLEDVSFRIDAGDFVAITGPNGQGKTTLMKLLLGVYKPTAGRILIDGIPLQSIDQTVWRRSLGVVMQDDSLFAATIADNISMFDVEPNFSAIRFAAQTAMIDGDISKLPMGYMTILRDRHVSLSGGQQQRILLARALYRQPKILFLDEGTANLDDAAEQSIANSIRSMNNTRLVIAHRTPLIERADRVLRISNSTVTELTTKAALSLTKASA